MKLLLVNDDGISSPFLHLLARAAGARGHHVTVCAPSQQQSTTSHSYHTSVPVTVRRACVDGADEAWAVDGTPVDCVRIALRCLCPDADAVLSGVNLGYNTGWPVFASGTVGAAREALFSGVMGMALSAEPRTPADTLARFLDWSLQLCSELHGSQEALGGVWNLNAPCVPLSELRGHVHCPLHRGIYADAYDRTDVPDGTMTFRLRGLPQPPPEPGSDLAMLEQGYMTCTLLTPGDALPHQTAAENVNLR